MQAIDHLLRGHSNSTDKESSLLLDNDVNELVELAAGVVLVRLASGSSNLCKFSRPSAGVLWRKHQGTHEEGGDRFRRERSCR